MPPNDDSPPLLTADSMKAFLEKTPLYVPKVLFLQSDTISGLPWPEIDAFCATCKAQKPFQSFRSVGGGAGMPPPPPLKSGTAFFEMTCVSCRAQKVEYLVFYRIITGKLIELQKYGQWPRQPITRDKVLEKLLTADAQNYEKALMCAANGYGIGAFAYLRRIVEDNISGLLDMLKEDAQATGADSDILAAIAELRNDGPMKGKIAIANRAVPPHLMVNGLNPLGRLYAVLSEGIHGSSDEECLARAAEVQECLKYLAGELATRNAHRADFVRRIGKL